MQIAEFDLLSHFCEVEAVELRSRIVHSAGVTGSCVASLASSIGHLEPGSNVVQGCSVLAR
eukprot:3709648-Amphidinium_carterae.1